MEKRKFAVALFMIAIIGAMNSYTFLLRGEVFASMQTGNIIKACIDIARGELTGLHIHFIPIIAFIIGILSHYFAMKTRFGSAICFTLIGIAYVGGFVIPFGALDCVAVSLLSFGVGIQLQLIRRVNGVDLATTMCTGNIRSFVEKLVKYIDTKDRSLRLGIVTYLSMVISFITGVMVTAIAIIQL